MDVGVNKNDWLDSMLTLLCLIGDTTKQLDVLERQESLPISRVLAKAWNDARLQEARQSVNDRMAVPPITVFGYRIQGETWYIPSDGNHRTVAAAEAGRRKIIAQVTGAVDCDMSRYVVKNGGLWIKDGGQLTRLSRDKLSQKVIDLALKLGAEHHK